MKAMSIFLLVLLWSLVWLHHRYPARQDRWPMTFWGGFWRGYYEASIHPVFVGAWTGVLLWAVLELPS